MLLSVGPSAKVLSLVDGYKHMERKDNARVYSGLHRPINFGSRLG